ncbi:MAG: ABC transporter ATP-binding protein, partial [Candidatus Marinimicrobia bacterium]|nr:ABC transporter ATP-binding protein [Candidatus Neomarinimicrobiota bacterium]
SVVRHLAHRTAVMYLGRLVEIGPTAAVIDTPRHPYTRALISAVPRLGAAPRQRMILPGDVPSPAHPPAGCRFHPRCPFAQPTCHQTDPALEPLEKEPARCVACLRVAELGRGTDKLPA